MREILTNKDVLGTITFIVMLYIFFINHLNKIYRVRISGRRSRSI
nr:MAG TPA: hypothetical protein [Caudoviricetes sp.]DAY21811.1 MAG TPA: hypothetical protein [Caudoviricetes sp.]